jgi:chorismate mutase/prephenate dehydratase
MKVAFQGERGAFSEESALSYFKNKIELVPCYSFEKVFEKVLSREVDYGIVPVENSYSGSVNDTFDLLLKYDVNIIGEKILRIKHNLIAHKNVGLSDIKKIYAHPQAIAQCDIFLEKINKQIIPFYDTAGSVKFIKENNLVDSASIASKIAAKFYDMNILQESIESNSNNYTRFFIISTSETKKAINNKTSIVFSTKNIPGALYKSLKPFAERKINLTKIESRPSRKKPWEYIFYLDFEGFIEDEKSRLAINELKKLTAFIKILGSYPKDEF